ncbi:bifunctional DedA family/phosphatase PAP2 family protein [Pseudomonas sp. NCHU5208]|uniref:bifunctional DedA family/phosphatase PAP2 family protein n=1 Tax=unclassified Pseudomonas TaxID=196821 RepID=UPI003F9A96E6
MSAWLDTLTTWLSGHPQWLGLAIFLIALLECLALVGILLPGVVLLFSVALLAGSGVLSLWETLLLAYAGGLCGDALSYALGRRFQNGITRLPILRNHPDWLMHAEAYFRRYGVASLLVGRFIGPLRPMLPLVAGMLDMPLVRFIAVTLVAAAGWAVAYLLPGWATGAALRLPMAQGFWTEAAVLLGAIGLILLLTIQASLVEKRRASLIAGGLSLLLLLGMILGWPHLDALDQGLLTLVQEQRQAHLDKWIVVLTRLGDFNTQLIAALVLCGLLLLARQWRHLLFAGSTLLFTALANTTLKHGFARARPDILSEPLTSFSFPSGHSSAAFAFFLVLGVLAGRGQSARLRLAWLVVAGLPALAIALSRVYLGVHWPSDIIAGAVLASAMCGLSLTFWQRHQVLPALPARLWWVVLPACLAVLGGMATWQLSAALLRYSY